MTGLAVALIVITGEPTLGVLHGIALGVVLSIVRSIYLASRPKGSHAWAASRLRPILIGSLLRRRGVAKIPAPRLELRFGLNRRILSGVTLGTTRLHAPS